MQVCLEGILRKPHGFLQFTKNIDYWKLNEVHFCENIKVINQKYDKRKVLYGFYWTMNSELRG